MGQTRADISLVSAILAYIHCYLAAVGRPPIHVQNSSPLRAIPSFLSGGGQVRAALRLSCLDTMGTYI